MPGGRSRKADLPCPVLDWANNPRTHHDRDRLQRLVNRIHARHPLRHASADVEKAGWRLDVASAVTGRPVRVPASLIIRRTPGGNTLLPPPDHYARDIVAELADALDEAARHVIHPLVPGFHATLVEMATLRSGCGHEEFARLIAQPLQPPDIEWRDDEWHLRDVPLRGDLRPGERRLVEYERMVSWSVRREAPDWEFDRERIHVLGATLPESVIPACAGRAFDDVFDVPDLKGAGLTIRAVKAGRRARGPSLRVTIAAHQMRDAAEAVAMSRAMQSRQETRI